MEVKSLPSDLMRDAKLDAGFWFLMCCQVHTGLIVTFMSLLRYLS